MKLTLFLVCLSISMSFAMTTNAQSTSLSFKATDQSIKEVLELIESQTDFHFFYNSKLVDINQVISVDIKDKDVFTTLDHIFENSNIRYKIVGKDVILSVKGSKSDQDEKTVTGTVVDETGEPIIGANIVEKGKANGTMSDLNGHFSIVVSSDAVLQISYIGFSLHEEAVKNKNVLQVIMKEDTQKLDEVVVVGYGSVDKKELTSAVTAVSSKDFLQGAFTSPLSMIDGKVSGVNVSNAAAADPNSSPNIQMRGASSIEAGNSPLVIIDGMPGADLRSVANQDIESITILKDGSAAAIYGSRAANGVVIITTKQGKAGKPVFKLKSDWGFSNFAMPFRELMGGQERRNLIHEGLRNYALTYSGKTDDEVGLHQGMTENEAWAYADSNIDQYAPIPWCGFVNWDDYLFRNGSHQNYEFSASGGQEKIKYYTSIGYMKQDGVTINSGLERISARLNVDYQMAKWMNIGAKIQFSKVNQDTYSEGTSYTSPIYGTRNGATPSDPIWNEDGTWNRALIKLDDRNPMLSNSYNFKREYATRSFNTVYASFDIWKGIKFASTFSYDFVMNKSRAWKDPRTSDGDDDNGRFSKDYNDITNMTWSNILTYQTKIKKKHNLDLLAGYEINSKESDGLGTTISNFARWDKPEVNNGVVYQSMGGSNSTTRIVSYITRANYDYDNKYYLGASWRTDGSSRLARENRWGNFWSLSGAWRVSSESFMKPLQNWLSDLKLRVSYGVNGTLPSSYYGYMGLSSLTSNYNDNPGITQSQLKNKELTWETNYNFNSGIDLGFFDNRLNVTFEYYVRTTKNLLYSRPLSLATGFSSYLANIGKLQNKGYELEIRSTNIETKDFRWSTSLNLGHNANKILKLDGDLKQVTSGTSIHKVGLPYSTYYMIEFAGIDPADGEPMFYKNTTDENGNLNKETTKDPRSAEKVILQCADPTITGGLGNSISYKWFDLNFNVNFSFGAWNYDGAAGKLEHGGDGTLNIPIYYRKRWQKEGDETSIERFVVGRSISMTDYATTRRLYSGDYVRLKNLTFGFTLPKTWTRKVGIDNIRLYASGNNLLTWAAYDYIDPESGSSPSWDTPPMRTYTFGLEVKF